MNTRTTQRLIWAGLGASLLLLGGFSLYKSLRTPAVHLEDYGTVPHFTLINEQRKPVTQNDLRGHIWIGDLIFTHCTSSCPMLTQKMFALQNEIKDQPDVKLVTFSVDPTHDTPDTLARYALAHKANPAQWTFLTGPVRTIYSVAKDGFHLGLDSVGGDQTTPIIHSSRFVLVDQQGHVRKYYEGNKDESRKEILADIENLKAESHS